MIFSDDIFGPGKNPEKIHKSGKIEKTKARYLVMNNLNFEELNTKNKLNALISYEDEKLIDDLPEHYDYKITKGKKKGPIKSLEIKSKLIEYLETFKSIFLFQ